MSPPAGQRGAGGVAVRASLGRTAPAVPPRPRRTQAERSGRTRRALLEAAVGCLVERGYAATTTQEVARRAGVSQGALFRHFPTRARLLVAAIERLYAGLRAGFRAELDAAAESDDRLAAALGLLAQTFARPEVVASLELHMAARTDAELRAALAPVAEEHRARILGVARELFPEAAARACGFETTIDLALSVLQGTVIGAVGRAAPSLVTGDVVAALEWLVRRRFDPVADEPSTPAAAPARGARPSAGRGRSDPSGVAAAPEEER